MADILNHFDIADWRTNRRLRNERLRLAVLEIVYGGARYSAVRQTLRDECDYMNLDKKGQNLFRKYDKCVRDVATAWHLATNTEKQLFTARLMPISTLAKLLNERTPAKQN